MYLPDKNLMPTQTPVVEAKAFTLPHLIAWLATMPPEQSYCWMSSGQCLFSQYGKYLHLGSNSVSPYSAAVAGMKKYYGQHDNDGEPRFNGPDGSVIRIAYREPHTFGAALTRARAALGAI